MKESIRNKRQHNKEEILNLFKNKKTLRMNDKDLSYLHIFKRASFGESSKEEKQEQESTGDDSLKNKYTKLSIKSPKDINYEYPRNVFNLIFFNWAKRILRVSNTVNKLELSDLGQFHPDYYPDSFLAVIKGEWQQTSTKTRSNP